MKKNFDFFGIDGVQYDAFTEQMTANQIREELDFFRKSNRPSYLFINALLTIQQMQHRVEYKDKIIDRLEKEIHDDKKNIILYWFMFIIGLIVCGVGFFTIVSFLIDLIK